MTKVLKKCFYLINNLIIQSLRMFYIDLFIFYNADNFIQKLNIFKLNPK